MLPPADSQPSSHALSDDSSLHPIHREPSTPQTRLAQLAATRRKLELELQAAIEAEADIRSYMLETSPSEGGENDFPAASTDNEQGDTDLDEPGDGAGGPEPSVTDSQHDLERPHLNMDENSPLVYDRHVSSDSSYNPIGSRLGLNTTGLDSRLGGGSSRALLQPSTPSVRKHSLYRFSPSSSMVARRVVLPGQLTSAMTSGASTNQSSHPHHTEADGIDNLTTSTSLPDTPIFSAQSIQQRNTSSSPYFQSSAHNESTAAAGGAATDTDPSILPSHRKRPSLSQNPTGTPLNRPNTGDRSCRSAQRDRLTVPHSPVVTARTNLASSEDSPTNSMDSRSDGTARATTDSAHPSTDALIDIPPSNRFVSTSDTAHAIKVPTLGHTNSSGSFTPSTSPHRLKPPSKCESPAKTPMSKHKDLSSPPVPHFINHRPLPPTQPAINISHKTGAGSGENGQPSQSFCQSISSPSGCSSFLRRFFSRRCTFSLVFSTLTALLICLTCVIIWWISRMSSYQVAQELSNNIRQVLFTDVKHQVNAELENGLITLRTLHFSLPLTFADVADQIRVTNQKGFLSPFLLAGAVNPSLLSFGYVNHNNVMVVLSKSSLFGRTFSARENLLIYISEINDTDHRMHLRTFRPKLLTSSDESMDGPSSTRVISWSSDLSQNETISNVIQYLGPPIYDYTFPPNRTIASYDAASDRLRTLGLSYTWSEPIRSPFVRSNNFTDLYVGVPMMRAYARMEDPSITLEQNSEGRAPMAFVDIDLRYFRHIFDQLDLHDHGVAFLLSPQGKLVASSDPVLDSWDLSSNAEADPLFIHVRELLFEYGLLTRQWTTALNVTSALASSTTVEVGFSWAGSDYLLQAAMVDSESVGLPFSYAIVTRDSDFYESAFIRASIIIACVSVGAAIIAVILAVTIANVLLHPITVIVNSMQKLIATLGITDPAQRRESIRVLQLQWLKLTGYETLGDLRVTAPAAGIGKNANVSAAGSTVNSSAPNSAPSRRMKYSTREVFLIQRAYSSMLMTMSSYDELQAVNDAKKRFIRYIFHEVRVPFNAMVLGIEQLQNDVGKHQQLLPDAIETLKILSDQSEVVSHILNDVLSLQKIEDNAYILSYSCFDMARMVRSTLSSFRAPCADRQLRFAIQLANIDRMAKAKLRALGMWGSNRPPLQTSQLITPNQPSRTTNANHLIPIVNMNSPVNFAHTPTTVNRTGARRTSSHDVMATAFAAIDSASSISPALRFAVWGDMVSIGNRKERVLGGATS